MCNIYSSNALLAALPEVVQQRLAPTLKSVHLKEGQVLYGNAIEMNYVYFPSNAVLSLLQVTQEGGYTGIGLVGKEGMLGISFYVGGALTPYRAIVQSAGMCFYSPADAVMESFNACDDARLLLLRYSAALVAQMAQITECNWYHTPEQHLVRWLLLSLQRTGQSRLAIRHEVIATTLGTTAQHVEAMLCKLEAFGLVRESDHYISVVDEAALQKRACNCHIAVHHEYDERVPQPLLMAEL
jgi:CRP-like cAMP-binding protein